MDPIEAKCKKLAEQLAWFAKQTQGTASHNNRILVNKIQKELVGMYYEGMADCRKGHET